MAPHPEGAARDPRIDTLRGLAIVLVVLHHLGLRIPLKNGVLADILPPWAIRALLFNGYEAVFLFFVVSGFLITARSLERWGTLAALDARAFYVQRAARILPCLLLLVAVLSALHGLGVRDYVIERPDQSLAGTVASALGLYLNWYEGRTSWLPGNWDVLWSLSIEEAFYLAFPVVVAGLRRERTLLAAMLAFGLTLPFWREGIVGNPIWREKAYLPAMAAIATGIAACLLAARGRPAGRHAPLLLRCASVAGLVAMLCFGDLLWRTIGGAAMLVLTFSAAALLLAYRWEGAPRAPWWTGWLRSFGRHSYEIYLTHMFLVWPVVHAWRAQGAPARWAIAWYLPYLAGAWLLGWLVARGFSQPVARWIRSHFTAGATRNDRPVAPDLAIGSR